jgi:hydroxylamine reductase
VLFPCVYALAMAFRALLLTRQTLAVATRRATPAVLFGAVCFSVAMHARAAPDMFCMQCEQTDQGKGCTVVGVCGKTPEVAALQDLLVDNIKGLSVWAHRARQAGVPENPEGNKFTLEALFSTLTNVNFDAGRFSSEYIPKAIQLRDSYKANYLRACEASGKKPDRVENDTTMFQLAGNREWMVEEAATKGVLVRRESEGEDIAGLQEMVVYGLKGVAAYAAHAHALGKESNNVYASIHQLLSMLGTKGADSKSFDALLAAALKVGETNLEVLAMLDAGHTSKYGDPVPTPVRTTPIAGKCILMSGHDLHDLRQLLEQTEGKGINVYTHGEMLPAHGYPELKKYAHLAGNYGGPWQLQKFEFAKFPGPIIMTTNCLVEPRKSYKDNIYTCNAVGWPGVQHIPDSAGKRDFSEVIAKAQNMEGFVDSKIKDKDPKNITVGFGHKTVLGVAGTVIEAVKKGDITHFFVIGGCDGSEGERNYYKELAESTPDSSIILTLGCGKYRFNKLDFGTVPNVGLPRVLDMGQCNDAYGAVVVATELAKAFNTDINSLPLSFAVSWFEQKAVAVLLTLLHLGVKDIVLGPNMPAFVGPKLGQLLSDNLGLRPASIQDVKADLARYLK